jgi:hypothetical protein
MISAVNKKVIETITNEFRKYKIPIKSIYNPDTLDIASEYKRNFKYRDDMKGELDNIIDKNKIDDPILFYKVNAPQQNSLEIRDRSLNVFFNDLENLYKNKIKDVKINEDVVSEKFEEKDANRFLKVDIDTSPKFFDDENKIRVRKLKFFDFSYECLILTSNQKLFDYITEVYLFNLFNQNKNFELVLEIPELKEPIEFNSLTSNFEDINSYGLMDLNQYGNIYQIGFDFKVTMPIISDFYTLSEVIEGIEIKVYLTGNDI